jgi:glutathione S-transferase
MSIQLYFSPGACSFVPHLMLEKAGVPFEPIMVKLHKGEQLTAEYKAINPNGQVPVLVDDGQVLTQILALVGYLDKRFPQAHILPDTPLARARAIELLSWFNNTVHPTFTHVFMPHKYSDQPDVQAAIRAHAVPQYRALISTLQARVLALPPGEWLAGAHLGPVDAYALTVTRWATMTGIAPDEMPDLWAFVQRVAADEAVQRVIARERLTLNMHKPPA